MDMRNTAWQFLKKNPKYQVDHQNYSQNLQDLYGLPIPIHLQSDIDQHAFKWGLFSFVYPEIQNEKTIPFWSLTPIITANITPNTKQPFLPFLQKCGAQFSAIRLLNNDLILQIIHNQHMSQIRIKDGHLFTNESSLSLHIPLDSSLTQHLETIKHIKNAFAGVQIKKAPFKRMLNILSSYTHSTFFRLENLTAR